MFLKVSQLSKIRRERSQMHLWRWNSSVWRWMCSSWSHRLSRAVRGNFTKRPALFFRNNNPSFSPSLLQPRHVTSRWWPATCILPPWKANDSDHTSTRAADDFFANNLRVKWQTSQTGCTTDCTCKTKAHVRSQSDSDTIRTKDPRRDSAIYQVNDRTCKMQNSRARPKFFHC